MKPSGDHGTQPETVPIETLDRMPYLGVLTYPRPDLKQARSKIGQLAELGIRTVTFEGRTRVGRLGLVGIGTVGVVMRGRGAGAEVLALKVRRADANRSSMREEFRLTRLANMVGVGAPVFGCTRDVIAMRYIEGSEVQDYVKSVRGRGSASRVREILHAILNQCRKLDLIGLDHGELSNLRKHVIVEGDEPCIIDFESASQRRLPRNVTTAAQYLLIGSSISPRVRRTLGVRSGEPVLEALRSYKADMSDESYARFLATFGVRI